MDGEVLLPGLCDRITCGGEVTHLALTILPCHSPPAIHLLHQGDGYDGFLPPYVDHTFTKTESLSVLVQGKISIITLTLVHLGDSIGIQVGPAAVFVLPVAITPHLLILYLMPYSQEDISTDGNTTTWIQYTEIPIDTNHCTGMGDIINRCLKLTPACSCLYTQQEVKQAMRARVMLCRQLSTK